MALTKEKLDEMQDVLIAAFDKSAEYVRTHSIDDSTNVSLVKMTNAILAIENEKRMRADYKPRATLQKD
jgi:hypothetical protein